MWSIGMDRITSYNVCYTKLLRPLLAFGDFRVSGLPHGRLFCCDGWSIFMLSIASIALYFNSAIFDHGDDGVVGMLAAA